MIKRGGGGGGGVYDTRRNQDCKKPRFEELVNCCLSILTITVFLCGKLSWSVDEWGPQQLSWVPITIGKRGITQRYMLLSGLVQLLSCAHCFHGQ